jgi:ubiquinone/menaquinone biosynthesis C-methylase UbiE
MPPVTLNHRQILDVGCGAGQTLMASNLSPGVLAVGVDIDHPALVQGRQVGAGIRFVRARGESLPFENQSFDLVICRVALPYMHLSRSLSEMARVLRTGGDLWLVMHPLSVSVEGLGTNIRRLRLRAVLYRLWVVLNGVMLHMFGKQWSWPLKPTSYETWQTSAAVKRALVSAGFEQILISRKRHFVVTAVRT